jgi:P4 family phage/plasmid primase-like protien
MNEAMEVFYNRKFKDRLDQNPYIIGFKNGVYDLKLNIFRDGRPDDYVSKCLPINYKDYDMADKELEFVTDFLMKVFPDKSVRTYFLDMYSDIFVGGNTQKVVLFWTGEGDNGKSITQNILEEMLGDLSVKFDTNLFTGKKTNLGSASPELARACPPVRSATMEEPDKNEELNIGYLKKLSGNDKYFARDLFEKGKESREIKPMFMLTFICNTLPKLKHSDQATWNRIRVIPFESTFVRAGEDCPETFEEQLLQKRFPRDSEFSDKIPKMLEAFAWYLLEWRKKVTVRIDPPKVREATEIYRKQNDIYRQYVEECVIQAEGASITLMELYAQFKSWYHEGFPNMSIPLKNDVKEYFEKLWGIPVAGKWRGYRIRTIRDNEDSILINMPSDDDEQKEGEEE